MKKTRLLLVALLIIFVIGLPILVIISQKKQEVRSHASASTTLSYSPNTTSTSPATTQLGNNVSFDVMVNPGNNQVSTVRLEIDYDPAILTPAASPFTVNTSSFPITQEGPIIQNGKVLISVNVGADPTKVITQTTKVGTVNFTAVAQTPASQPSSVTFGSATTILSTAPSDQASENVLSSTIPAYLQVSAVSASTPTPTLTITQCPERPAPPPGCFYQGQDTPPACDSQLVCPALTPTVTPTSTPAPTQIASTPTPLINPTILNLSVLMDGIGSAGDNVNPTSNSLSNKNPLTTSRNVTVQIFDVLNQLVVSANGTLNYNSNTGIFNGDITLPSSSLSSSAYTVKVVSPTHLRRLVPGIQNILIGQNNPLSTISLIAGDANNDNVLNILDYNLIIGCYSDLSPATSCTPDQKAATDLNDDGQVNQVDYNLFLRELSVQSGQ